MAEAARAHARNICEYYVGRGEWWDPWNRHLAARDPCEASLGDVGSAHRCFGLYVNDVTPRYDPRFIDASAQTNTWRKRSAYLLKRSALLTWIYWREFLPWPGHESERERSVEEGCSMVATTHALSAAGNRWSNRLRL